MENQKSVELLEEIKVLLSHKKKVMTVDDLAIYTGLSKSKIYKLTHTLKVRELDNFLKLMTYKITDLFFLEDFFNKLLLLFIKYR